MSRPVNPVLVAAKFRYYADLCREFAACGSPHSTDLRKQAERWEADARMVDLDARIIERSKVLIAEAERLISNQTSRLDATGPSTRPCRNRPLTLPPPRGERSTEIARSKLSRRSPTIGIHPVGEMSDASWQRSMSVALSWTALFACTPRMSFG
jgi:hypothetical protein